jgi:hypothetical protein
MHSEKKGKHPLHDKANQLTYLNQIAQTYLDELKKPPARIAPIPL